MLSWKRKQYIYCKAIKQGLPEFLHVLKECCEKRETKVTGAAALKCAGSVYLAQVAGDAHVMPGIVVKLAIDRLNEGLEGPRAQVDDQPHRATLQGQVDVISRLASVQHEAIALQRSEGERNLVGAALDWRQGQVVAEELVPLEGGDRLFFTCRQN